MRNAKKDWRRQIDDIIEFELLAVGFTSFDGISYSFPVSAESLGVVQIQNQYLRANGTFCNINTHLGVIHYQLNDLATRFASADYEHWFWTLGRDWSPPLDFGLPYVEMYKEKNNEDKQKSIASIVAELKAKGVPYICDEFQTIGSITEFLVERKRCTQELFCVALATNGQATTAKARADRISSDMKAARVNQLYWPIFKNKFDEWFTEGAAVPDLDEARARTLQAAADRAVLIANFKPNLRPTW